MRKLSAGWRLTPNDPQSPSPKPPSTRYRHPPARQRGLRVRANERGEKLVWLEDAMADRLGAMRKPGESYGDVILRIAAEAL
jgi:hypothetical protein